MDNVTELLEIFTCPICKEFMFDNIYQCENGHLYCESCFNQIKKCSSCNIPMIDKNRALSTEQIRDCVELPCQNQDCKTITSNHKQHNEICEYHKCACGLLGNKKDLRRHQKICGLRILSCPFDGCIKSLQANNIYFHLTEKHQVNYNSLVPEALINMELPDEKCRRFYSGILYDTIDILELGVIRNGKTIIFELLIISQRFYSCSLSVRIGKKISNIHITLPQDFNIKLVELLRIFDENFDYQTQESDEWYPSPYYNACLTITPIS